MQHWIEVGVLNRQKVRGLVTDTAGMSIVREFKVQVASTPRFSVQDHYDGTKLKLMDMDEGTMYHIDCGSPEGRAKTFYWTDTDWSALLSDLKGQ